MILDRSAYVYLYLPPLAAALLVPPIAVMVTWTVPVPAGTVIVISLAETTFRRAAFLVPKCTAVTPMRFAPRITTLVPPLAGPFAGDSDKRAGAAMYWYVLPFAVVLVPPAVVTVTWTVPLPTGAMTVSSVVEMTFRPVAALLPKCTELT